MNIATPPQRGGAQAGRDIGQCDRGAPIAGTAGNHRGHPEGLLRTDPERQILLLMFGHT